MATTMGGRILIAEDDRAVRQSLERTLRVEGFDVSGVRSASSTRSAPSPRRPLPSLAVD